MPQRHDLKSLLSELHDALEQPEPLDDAARAELRALLTEIEEKLDRSDGDDTLVERVEASLEQFEGEHPRLVALLGRLADLLNSIGI